MHTWKKNLIIGLLGLLLLSGCRLKTGSSDSGKADKLLPFEILSQGSFSFQKEAQHVIVLSNNDFETIWQKVFSPYYPKDKIPQIDFSTTQVIGIFLGEKPTGGYQISVSKIVQTDSVINIYISIAQPRDSGIATTIVTEPYQLIKFEKTNLPLHFIYQ